MFGKNQTGYYNLYYHAGSQGNLPTDIYWASSTNVVEKNWRKRWTTYINTGNQSKFDYDQVADPSRIKDFIYFDGDNNVNATCAIGLSRRNMSVDT